MGVSVVMTDQVGYYSIVRYCGDTSRGESRNVAIVLAGGDDHAGGVRAAPISRVAPKARQAGLLDALLRGLAERVQSGGVIGEAGLRELAAASNATLTISMPKPFMDTDRASALQSLYRSFVGVASSREPRRKGEILDCVVAQLVRNGAPLERNAYVDDFAVDVLLTGTRRATIQVLSFWLAETRGVTVEREAGHYLFGLERTGVEAVAVVQPPSGDGSGRLWQSHDRVQRWLEDAGVRAIRPDDLAVLSERYGGGHQLPLAYA
jgi:hypothetical protein